MTHSGAPRWSPSTVNRRVGAGLLVAAAGLLLGACGSTTPASSATHSPSPSASDSGNDGSDNTPLPTDTAAPGAQTVHITLGEMYVRTDVTTFKVGQPYYFIVHNEGKIVHEWTIAHKVPGGNQDSRDAAAVLDTDGIQGGQTFMINYTFTQPPPPEGMEMECSYPGHYEQGMHVDITLTA